jgi:hypothetical protein
MEKNTKSTKKNLSTEMNGNKKVNYKKSKQVIKLMLETLSIFGVLVKLNLRSPLKVDFPFCIFITKDGTGNMMSTFI